MDKVEYFFSDCIFMMSDSPVCNNPETDPWVPVLTNSSLNFRGAE